MINFSKSPFIYLFILIFIDIFDLYRNIYRSIFKIYVIIARLNWRERKRRINILSLALNPHENKFFDVIKVFEFGLTILNKKMPVEINDIYYTLCVFIMTFIENMKQ